MRNISFLMNSHIVTYQINGGEYNRSLEEKEIPAIIEQLARAFEADKGKVYHDFQLAMRGSPDCDFVTPSEYRVLEDFVRHLARVRELEKDDWHGTTSQFLYYNLNDDVYVSWIHVRV